MKSDNKQRTVESYIIANGKKGYIFYSTKPDRHLTAIASQHNRSIRTTRIVAVESGSKTPKCNYITKIVLLN